MSDIGRYLLDTETAVVVVRRHWAFLTRQAFVLLACLIGAQFVMAFLGSVSFFRWCAAGLSLGSLAWFGWHFGDWWAERFVVTDKRVLLMNGLLTRRLAIMPLTKVTDMTYERSIPGRVLGYGVFVMESAGQDQALSRVEYLPSPDRVYRDVSMLLFGPKTFTATAPAPLAAQMTEIVPQLFDDHTTRIQPDDYDTARLPRN